MKFDSLLSERFADICCIQLEIRQRFIRVRVFIQFRLWDWLEKCHYGWATHNDNRLLFCRAWRDRKRAKDNTDDR